MKIHNLKFKNINSLKGEHEIYFNESPLSQAGIFAIVGPTGSGKSSILDVITLALFNRIPRFDNKAITTNSITKEGSVLTHHTAEAYAEIEYEIKNKIYKSTWSISTNRNGKLRDYEMTLYKPDGSVADLKKSEVPGANEKIIGLNYDQFIKAILLSQGEFAKFLKAHKNDRGKLLEKITGTSIYRKIGQGVHLKHKEVKERLEREKERIGDITTLDDEERSELTNQLNFSKKEKENLEIVTKELNQVKQIKSEINDISNSLEKKQAEFNDIINEISKFQTNSSKLKLHQKLSHLQGELTSYKIAVNNAQDNKRHLIEYKDNLEAAENKFQKTISDLRTLTQSDVNAENFKKVMNAFETEINNADRDLQNLKIKGSETRARINNQLVNYPTQIDKNINPKDAIIHLNSRAENASTIIHQAKLDPSTSIQDIRSHLKKEQDKFNNLNTVKDKYSQIKELQSKVNELKTNLEKLKLLEKSNLPLIDKTKKLIETETEKIGFLTKQKEDAIRIANLEDLRDKLISGEACPLCGSTEHPYTEHLPKQQESEIEAKIGQSQKDKQQYQEELTTLNTALTKCLTSIKLTNSQIEESSSKMRALQSEVKTMVQSLESITAYEPNQIDEAIKILSARNIKTEKAIEALEELKLNKTFIAEYHELQNILQEFKILKNARLEKYKGANVNEETNKLQDDFEKSHSKITELKTVIKKENESLEGESKLIKSLEDNLHPKVKEMGFSNIKELSSHLLDENTVNILIQKRDTLNNQKVKLETEVKTLQLSLGKKIESDSKPDLELTVLIDLINQEIKKTEDHQKIFITNQERLKRDDEDRKKLKSKERTITKLNQELEKWALLNKMIGDANGNKFANFAQGLTLQNLLVYANRRLTNLSDRYLLDKPENDGPLIVIDKYQGNTSRSVTTLSGGESFLISLALALSLSDMASKNVALECLFIDEGFGTLDPDSLESALNTLEKLQSESQKTVGVISHVEALKERIDVQIKLNKNAQGYSTVEVVG